MLRTLKIWWLRRQITRLEQAEDEAKASMLHLQYKILPHYRAEPLPVSLIYPHRRNLSRRVHLFMEWLGGLMKNYVD